MKYVLVGVVDHGPMARFEVVKADANTPTVVFQKLTDPDAPQTLREIAKAWGIPAGRFEQWFVTEHAELDEAAYKVLARRRAEETIGIADDATAEDVRQRKLQIGARQWFAARADRQRFGEQVNHQVTTRTVLEAKFYHERRGREIDVTPEDVPQVKDQEI